MRGAVTPEEVFSLRALWAAARRAEREKRKKPEVALFRLGLESALVSLRDELLTGRWRPAPTRALRVQDPKPRVIAVQPFRDRVVHQALWAVLDPRVKRRMIRDSYACRAGYGAHAALRRARAWARTWRWFVHLDVERYFPSIDHAVVRSQLARDVPERWLRALCESILAAGGGDGARRHVPGDDLFTPSQRATGLPLGNLTSQLWANRYLDPVDHLVKDRLRLRGYLRYMDDLLLFHDDRAQLESLARQVEESCWGVRLRLHPGSVRPTAEGVTFVGYRVLRDHVRVRRTSVARAEARLARKAAMVRSGRMDIEAFSASLRATFGHWRHADSWRLRGRTLARLGLLATPGPLLPDETQEP